MTCLVRIADTGSANPKVVNLSSRKSASSQQWRKEPAYSVANTARIDIAINDIVEIYLPPGRTILSAARLFLLPAIMFLLSYFLAIKLFPNGITGILSGDELAFLAGLSLLLLCILIAAFSRHRTAGPYPEIVRRLEQGEIASSEQACGSCGICGN
ncbi:MAG: hypothetical protein B0D92_06150 [Spirochaeta sp. LUC14_002_19_P3]|nr:MAG: hypothetical protein B0D92_06150 [Spirochaeta sp. LUC14_002_19_P3]